MNRLDFLRLSAALAMALTLMACASSPRTEASVFDTLARAGAAPQQAAGSCDARFEVRSCRSTTGIRKDGDCTCLPREALRDLRAF